MEADLRVLSGVGPHLIVRVLRRHGLKLRKAFAEPGSDRALHVDGKWLKTFLEATDGKEPQGAHTGACPGKAGAVPERNQESPTEEREATEVCGEARGAGREDCGQLEKKLA